MAIQKGVNYRKINASDFFWLKDYNCAPLNIERDSIYLFFCIHFSSTAFIAIDVRTKKPIGFLLGFLPAARKTAYIHYLFVDEERRNSDIGTNLVKLFSKEVKKLNASEVLLYTARASLFYKKLGFKKTKKHFPEKILNYLAHVKKVNVMELSLK